ncbi:MAG TPA: lactate racemase domain-containing protein [Candidatus Baltobacteraceae bacterium]|nr:lactate racemase domain-containing protein [Candidatus Baltobacteraceae bacterium]
MQIKMRWCAWHGDTLLAIDFPGHYAVSVHPPRDGADIGDEGIRRAFAAPIASAPLAALARCRRSAVIAVDDIARPTPAARLIPAILRELHAGGLPDAGIRFVMALGCHRAMTRAEMAWKLGEGVVRTYEVLNHTPYERLVRVGETSRGTPVDVNGAFAEADLRIGVGQISPHGGPGWSGGGKVVIPGVAGIETITVNHKPGRLARGLLRIDGNEWRADLEEAARMAGLDFVVNAVVNSSRGLAGLFTGDPVAAHREGVARAREVMATHLPAGPVDVGVFNQYPKDTEFMHLGHGLHVLNSAPRPLVRPGGTLVILSASSDGFGFHTLEAPGMRHGPTGPAPVFAPYRVIVMCPTINRAQLPPSLPAETCLVSDWTGVLAALAADHPQGGRVAVFPCGAIQIAAPE